MAGYGRLLSDTKSRENLPQNIVGECFARDLTKRVQRAMQTQQDDLFQFTSQHQTARVRQLFKTLLQRGMLTRIERADYDVFSRVIRVPRPQRAVIAAAVWARTLVIGR